jgi:hypothetical protein
VAPIQVHRGFISIEGPAHIHAPETERESRERERVERGKRVEREWERERGK